MGIDETKAFMRRAHANQVDKGGEAYHEHAERVLEYLMEIWPDASLEAQKAALLHDVIEDSNYSAVDLKAAGFSEETVEIVLQLTRDKADGRSYQEWIDELGKEGRIEALFIKLADNRDNSDPRRLAKLPEHAKRLEQRYLGARMSLEAALDRRTLPAGADYSSRR